MDKQMIRMTQHTLPYFHIAINQQVHERIVKQKHELRDSIISIVQQSTHLQCFWCQHEPLRAQRCTNTTAKHNTHTSIYTNTSQQPRQQPLPTTTPANTHPLVVLGGWISRMLEEKRQQVLKAK